MCAKHVAGWNCWRLLVGKRVGAAMSPLVAMLAVETDMLGARPLLGSNDLT